VFLAILGADGQRIERREVKRGKGKGRSREKKRGKGKGRRERKREKGKGKGRREEREEGRKRGRRYIHIPSKRHSPRKARWPAAAKMQVFARSWSNSASSEPICCLVGNRRSKSFVEW
jgi:hypothetical protein